MPPLASDLDLPVRGNPLTAEPSSLMFICLLCVTQSMVWYRFDLYHTSHSMIETQHTTQQTMYVCIVTVGSTQQHHPPPTITRNHPRPPPTTSGHPPPPTTTHHRPPVTPDHPRSPPITSTKSWSITQFIYRHEVTKGCGHKAGVNFILHVTIMENP